MLDFGISYSVAVCERDDVFLLKTVGSYPKPITYVVWSPYGSRKDPFDDVRANYLLCALFSQKFESYSFYDVSELYAFLRYGELRSKSVNVERQMDRIVSSWQEGDIRELESVKDGLIGYRSLDNRPL